MLIYEDTPDHVQAFRPVHKSQKPSTTSASLDSDDVTFIDCHTDPETHKDFILWVDIQQAFDEALLIRHKTKMLAFLKGPNYQTLEPRRIAAVPGIVLDVVVSGELPGVDVRIIQDLSLSTLPSSCTPHNPVYGLEEKAMENYNHVDISVTSQLSFQGSQVISACDQQEGSSGHRTSTESQPTTGTTNVQRREGPQENGAATSMDLMQTMIRAGQGNTNAQVALGDRYRKGDGVSRDRQAALDWYLKAAEQGHVHAQCNIGVLFCAEDEGVARIIDNSYKCGVSVQDNGDSELDGVDDIPRDRAKGLEWFLKAAHQGLAAAQFAVALFMFIDSDYDQANPDPTLLSTIIDWVSKAADQDHAMAQVFLAKFCGQGIGVPKDGAEAIKLVLKAVNRSGGIAECILGRLSMKGVAIPQDNSIALEWFVKGAEQGHNECQYEVAKSYKKRNGILVDRKKAIEWYTKASQNGHLQAKSDLKRLTGK
ncbi:hypothetical protein BGX24_000787 [Mortierella sp. AD032]|nr:hypothetical protein BGX24_000787 [Mortierella sp. AD032]